MADRYVARKTAGNRASGSRYSAPGTRGVSRYSVQHSICISSLHPITTIYGSVVDKMGSLSEIPVRFSSQGSSRDSKGFSGDGVDPGPTPPGTGNDQGIQGWVRARGLNGGHSQWDKGKSGTDTLLGGQDH